MKMTFEEVDDHVNELIPGTPAEAAPEIKGKKLKEIWRAAKPILHLIILLPVIPKKWKIVVTALLTGIEELLSDKNSFVK